MLGAEADTFTEGLDTGCEVKRGVRDDLFSLELPAGGSGKEESCKKSRFLE